MGTLSTTALNDDNRFGASFNRPLTAEEAALFDTNPLGDQSIRNALRTHGFLVGKLLSPKANPSTPQQILGDVRQSQGFAFTFYPSELGLFVVGRDGLQSCQRAGWEAILENIENSPWTKRTIFGHEDLRLYESMSRIDERGDYPSIPVEALRAYQKAVINAAGENGRVVPGEASDQQSFAVIASHSGFMILT